MKGQRKKGLTDTLMPLIKTFLIMIVLIPWVILITLLGMSRRKRL